MSLFYILHGPTLLKASAFLVIHNWLFLLKLTLYNLGLARPNLLSIFTFLCSFYDANDKSYLSPGVCSNCTGTLSFLHFFHSTTVDASHMSPVSVDTAVCRTACSSTPVQIQMGILSYLLVGTTNPHCVQEPLQFYSWLVYCSSMLFMSVSTQSHAHCFVNALNDLKILVICSCSFQDNQEFSPIAPQLCKFISGTTHPNFILQNSWHTVARSGQKWLGISRWPQPLFMISSTADLWFFSPCRVLKEVENISICYTLTRYCFLPIWTLLLWLYLNFGCYLLSKFCLPWHLYFP